MLATSSGNAIMSMTANNVDASLAGLHFRQDGAKDGHFGLWRDAGTTDQYRLVMEINAGGVSDSSNKFVMLTDGKIGIGTNVPDQSLEVEQTGEGNVFRINDGTHTCDMDPDAAVVDTCASDARLKENIRDPQPVLDYLTGIKIRDFEWINNKETDTGVVAQEIMDDYPELISEDEDGYYMAESISSWKLVKAIQEQQEQIEELRARIEELES